MIKYRRLKYLGKGSYGAAILVELKSNPSTKYVMKEIIIGNTNTTANTTTTITNNTNTIDRSFKG